MCGEKSYIWIKDGKPPLNIKDNWRLKRDRLKTQWHSDKCFSATFCCMHSCFWTLRLWSIWSRSDVLFPAEGSSLTNFTMSWCEFRESICKCIFPENTAEVVDAKKEVCCLIWFMSCPRLLGLLLPAQYFLSYCSKVEKNTWNHASASL